MKTGINGEMLFYSTSRFPDLMAFISLITGIIIFWLICIYFKAIPASYCYKILVFFTILELPWMIFFLKRFLKPVPILAINSRGIEVNSGFKSEYLSWQQIDSVIVSGIIFQFKTKNNIDSLYMRCQLQAEDKAILKEIFKKHDINWLE